MKKILITLIFLGLVVLPGITYAADISTIIGNAATQLTTIATALIVLMIVWAGILFLTANGEPDKVSKARQAALWAIIGGVVVLSAEAVKTLIKSIAGTT